MSPYSVEKPAAISLLLPVVSTSQPNLLDSAISVVPRTRACRFSSARSGSRPSKLSDSMSRSAVNAGSMGMTRYSMPSVAARSRASSFEPWLE